MSNYYDPWQHAINIFVKRIFQFIALTILLSFFIWYFWVHYYFEIALWDASKQVFKDGTSLLKALFTMCFISAGTITGWLFTWLIRRLKNKNDNHYRGSRIDND